MTNAGFTHVFVLSSSTPKPGHLVEVRRRQWIVSDIDPSGVSPGLPKRNLVKLASIDEDAFGEEIEVLWGIEPGVHATELAGLSTLSALDHSSKLEAFLDVVPWGAAPNAARPHGFCRLLASLDSVPRSTR